MNLSLLLESVRTSRKELFLLLMLSSVVKFSTEFFSRVCFSLLISSWDCVAICYFLKKPLRIDIKLTIFQTTRNLTQSLKMTSEMVESAWVNIGFFSSPSGNTKSSKKT